MTPRPEKWGYELEPGDCVMDGQCWFLIKGWVEPAPCEGERRAYGIWGAANGWRNFRDNELYAVRVNT